MSSQCISGLFRVTRRTVSPVFFAATINHAVSRDIRETQDPLAEIGVFSLLCLTQRCASRLQAFSHDEQVRIEQHL